MKETAMYHKMQDKLSPMGILLQRIEMDRVPDLFYRTLHHDGWIELKQIHGVPIKNYYIKVPFRPGQYNWIRSYRAINGRVFLFFSVANDLFIFEGVNIKERYSRSEMLKLNCYYDPWKSVDWKQVYNILDINRH